MRIEGYSQYTRNLFPGQYGVIQSDLRIGTRLCKLIEVVRVVVDFGAKIAKPRSSAYSSIFGEWK